MDGKIYIKELSWKNIFLEIHFESLPEDPSFKLRELGSGREFDFSYDLDTSGEPVMDINIAQVEGRSFLDNGEYALIECSGAEPAVVLSDYKCCYTLDDASRIFMYDDITGNTYNISFITDQELASSDKGIALVIRSSFLKVNKGWKRNLEGIRKKVAPIINALLSLKKRNGIKNILFLTQAKDKLSGNLKVVRDRFLERGLDKRYDLFYYEHNDVTNGLSIGRMLRIVKLFWKCDVIFVDDYFPVLSYITPPKGTKIIQLWHAGVGFKSVGYSRFGKPGSPHPQTSCHRKYTMATCATDEEIEAYREVFGIEKEAFLSCGMPRLDGFLDEGRIEEARAEIYERYPMLKDKRVILFAPTYRGAHERVAYYDYDKVDQKKIAELCGNDTVFLVKMHPFIRDKFPVEDFAKDVIIDASDYPDINRLYYVTDLLITDYSSNYYEYSLLRRPVIFYCYDIDEYQITRGVHRFIRDVAPGKVCETFDEMIEAIKNEDYDLEKTVAFGDKVRSHLGSDSTDTIIDTVLGTGRPDTPRD